MCYTSDLVELGRRCSLNHVSNISLGLINVSVFTLTPSGGTLVSIVSLLLQKISVVDRMKIVVL